MGKIIFLFLSLISGMMELGGVLYAIKNNFSVLQIVGVGLAYQIGNLVPNPIKLGKKTTILSALLCILCLGYYLFISMNYWILVAGFIFSAMAIQSLRTFQKGNIPTAIKRTFRILGFILSIFIGRELFLSIGVILMIISALIKWPYAKFEVIKPKISFINVIMVTHQIHYFVHAYFIIVMIRDLVYKSFGTNDISLLLISVLFTLGWITYTGISLILRKKHYFRYFIIGHLYLSIVVLFMAMFYNNFTAVILWVLTGFGGGTVFCINKINEITEESSKSDIIFSENLGHIAGVVIGMFTYAITDRIDLPMYQSFIFAGATALLMTCYYYLKVRRQLTQNTSYI